MGLKPPIDHLCEMGSPTKNVVVCWRTWVAAKAVEGEVRTSSGREEIARRTLIQTERLPETSLNSLEGGDSVAREVAVVRSGVESSTRAALVGGLRRNPGVVSGDADELGDGVEGNAPRHARNSTDL